MHLACYTQEQIAEAVGMSQRGIGVILEKIPNLEFVLNLGDFSNITALASVELSKGGAGKKGGLREYARQIGRAHPQVVQWIQSAEVAKTGKTFYQLFDRTYHLAAIHAAPQELWPVFVDGPIGPSVSQSDAPIGAPVSQSDAGRAVQANWPEQESGQARDHVANLFGVSPRAVERAETVYRDRRNLSDADMLRWIGEIDKRKTAGRPKEGEQKLTPSGVNLSDNHHARASSAATAAVVGTSARKVEQERAAMGTPAREGNTLAPDGAKVSDAHKRKSAGLGALFARLDFFDWHVRK